MSFQIDGSLVSEQNLTAEMTTIQVEAAWDDASDSELEARISKDNWDSGYNYC